MAKITTPVEGFNGTVVGVTFVDGHGETDNPVALAYFTRQGYTVEADEAPAGPEGDPSDKWTADQLKDYAKTHDITVSGNKGEVLKTITDTLTERKAEADKAAADEAAKAAAGDNQPATGDAS